MAGWGIFIFITGLILYFATKKKPFWLFVSGVGAGLIIGAIWAMSIVNDVLEQLAP